MFNYSNFTTMEVYVLTKESTDKYNQTCIHSIIGVFTSLSAAKKVVIAARKAVKETKRFHTIKYDVKNFPARLTYQEDIYFHDWCVETIQTDDVNNIEKVVNRYLYR